MEIVEEGLMLSVNDENIAIDLKKGYARIHRMWKEGDVIELDLPMPVRCVLSHPNVEEDAGKVALERGPLVYCVEGIDHGERALDILLPDDVKLYPEVNPELLKGLTVIKGKALLEGKEIELMAIPYYAWSHRGVGEMAVWLNRKK